MFYTFLSKLYERYGDVYKKICFFPAIPQKIIRVIRDVCERYFIESIYFATDISTVKNPNQWTRYTKTR